MKQRITRKEVKQRFSNKIVAICYCCAQQLLSKRQPSWVWYSDTWGWYCDIYLIDGVAVTTGYKPFGTDINLDKLNVLEKQAFMAYRNNDNDKLSQLDDEFIKLIHETVKG